MSEGIFDVYGFDAKDGNLLSQRIPMDIAETVNKGVLRQGGQAAGGRVRFFTNSMTIAYRVEFAEANRSTCLSACATYGFDLYTSDETGKETFIHAFRPTENELSHCTFVSVCDRSKSWDKEKASKGMFYTMNMPCFAEISKLYIGLDKDCILRAGKQYINSKPAVFYGSSITHGAAACRPGNTYEALISQKYNLNYVNLGFAGHVLGEQTMAQYIAGREMSMFICDYDHNASTDRLRQTHYPFYEIIREKHPDIPYIMISKPDFRSDPKANGVRRSVIKTSYEKAKENGDKKVYFIDGETLFEGDFCMSCTIDGVHPNDLGFYRMAQVIGKVVAEAMGLE